MGKTTAPLNGQGSERGSPSPDQLRAEMTRTRDEMAGTLEELHGKLNPTVLKEQAIEQFHEAREKVKGELLEDFERVKSKLRDEVREARSAVREATVGRVENMYHEAGDKVRQSGHTLMDTVKSNPIPAALTGVGLTWLFIQGRARRRQYGRPRYIEETSPRRFSEADRYSDVRVYGEAYVPEMPTAAGGPAEGPSVGPSVKERVRGFAEEAGSSVASARERIGEAADGLKERTTERAQQVAQETQMQAQRIRRRGIELFDENPLAVGAAFVALGAAIGFFAPRTRREDRLLGRARDRMMGKAQEMAHGALDKVEEQASRLADQLSGEEEGDGRDEEEIGDEGQPLHH